MQSPLLPHIERLRELSRVDADLRARRRAQCLIVCCASKSMNAASRALKVDTKTLRRWTRRFLVEGRDGLVDRPRSGRPRTLDADAEALIERVLAELPTEYGYATASWTLSDLRDLLADKGWEVSLGTVERALHRLGYCYRRPRHDLDHRQDADAVASVQHTLAVLQKKGVITQAEYDSCISTSVICTPIPTWQKSGNHAVRHARSLPPESISGSRSLAPWITAPEA